MKQFTYHLANSEDIEILVKHRMAFLREVSGDKSLAETTAVERQLRQYFPDAVAHGHYIGYIAKDGQTVAAMGGMVVRHRPANYNCPHGMEGYVMSMYTVPEYRKQGLAHSILDKLAAHARILDIDILELHATAEGEPVYRQFGFAEPRTRAMEYKLR